MEKGVWGEESLKWKEGQNRMLLHNPSSVRKLTAEPQPPSSLMLVHMIVR